MITLSVRNVIIIVSSSFAVAVHEVENCNILRLSQMSTDFERRKTSSSYSISILWKAQCHATKSCSTNVFLSTLNVTSITCICSSIVIKLLKQTIIKTCGRATIFFNNCFLHTSLYYTTLLKCLQS